jgi:hypothetical protein
MRHLSSGLFMTKIQCFGSGLILVGWIRIRIQEGNNDPKNIKRVEISSFEVLDILF